MQPFNGNNNYGYSGPSDYKDTYIKLCEGSITYDEFQAFILTGGTEVICLMSCLKNMKIYPKTTVSHVKRLHFIGLCRQWELDTIFYFYLLEEAFSRGAFNEEIRTKENVGANNAAAWAAYAANADFSQWQAERNRKGIHFSTN
jgi:hypothetical protein